MNETPVCDAIDWKDMFPMLLWEIEWIETQVQKHRAKIICTKYIVSLNRWLKHDDMLAENVE